MTGLLTAYFTYVTGEVLKALGCILPLWVEVVFACILAFAVLLKEMFPFTRQHFHSCLKLPTTPVVLIKVTGEFPVVLSGVELDQGYHHWVARKAFVKMRRRTDISVHDPNEIVYMAVNDKAGIDYFGHHLLQGWCGEVRLGYAVDVQKKQKDRVYIFEEARIGFQFQRKVSYNGITRSVGEIIFCTPPEASRLEDRRDGLTMYFEDILDELPLYRAHESGSAVHALLHSAKAM